MKSFLKQFLHARLDAIGLCGRDPSKMKSFGERYYDAFEFFITYGFLGIACWHWYRDWHLPDIATWTLSFFQALLAGIFLGLWMALND
jgi:hypothetical protein